tara:strand:- start:104130 stop:104492 length:363 start_codon:yes stop_codon:yes gene_type:complete
MINKIKLYALALILIIAGVIHLINPKAFLIAMPPYIPWHLEIIYLTGLIEIILAIGLILKKYRYRAAKVCALYFIAILPAHIHVALNGIEMFGVNDPIILWGRTLFQAVFIWWAWSLRRI